jgi:integrase
MLTDVVEQFIELRVALGFQFRVQACLLRSFARYAERMGDSAINATTVLKWAAEAPSRQQRKRRAEVVGCLARHARAQDPRHELVPRRPFGSTAVRRLPHIYAPEEIQQILSAASKLGPEGSLRPLTYTTLLGLLASCGLRISEALRLDIPDLTKDGLIVRKTKFRKSRLVPVHATTRRQLQGYIARRIEDRSFDESLFISLRGNRLAYPTVVSTFLHLLRSVGLRPGPGQPGPHIHDIRHTFAVRSLEQCPCDRNAVARHMLGLATYLGHAHVSDTFWYLHTTPTLLRDIAESCEQLARGGRQ